MTENRNNLQKYAMHFGTFMGIYWILKFILFPLGFTIPFLSFLFLALTLAVPFLGFHYVKMYRNKICGGAISFSQAMIFTVFMYMFASLLVAVAHYIYFKYIDHGFIIDLLTKQWNALFASIVGMEEYKTAMMDAIENAQSLTAVDITLQCLSTNVLWGVIFSIPTALAVMKKGNPESQQPFQS